MKITRNDFVEEDKDTWVALKIALPSERPPVGVRVFIEDWPLSDAALAKIRKVLMSTDSLVFRAAELILENYSYEHFIKLKVPMERLVEETPAAIAAAVSLESISFFDLETNEVELSFTAPWDPQHTFDVEFEGGKATGCSVNG